MKKILLLACVAMVLAPLSSFAAISGGSQTVSSGMVILKNSGTKGGEARIGISNGVNFYYYPDTTAGQGYIAGTFHTGGDRTYGSSSGDTNIFYHDGTGATLPTTVPTGTGTADFSGSGFSAL